jgi:uncharacterized protein YbjQ (UPF0145 family)
MPCSWMLGRWGLTIIGVAYDANEVMEKCTEVLCYGTAVILEKE